MVDLILVVGASNSSNSNRLREIGAEAGVPSYLVADGSEIDPAWFVGKSTIGITAGASAPEVLVDDVINALRAIGPVEVETLAGVEESVEFRLPRELERRLSGGSVPVRAGHADKERSVGIPLNQVLSIGGYIVGQHLRGRRRYPLVLMLEPLFRCNLACAGCGKIDYPEKILNQRLSVDDCMGAIDECGAPVVVLAGGEPLLHKELPQIVEGALAKGKFVTVCTNALLMDKKLDLYRPHSRFNWSVHLDGDEEMHDKSVCQKGVYPRAIAAIKNAKAKGFRVNINCTLFSDAQAGPRRPLLRHGQGAGRRRDHDLARLCLRACARPAALPQSRKDQAAVPRHLPPRARRARRGRSSSRRCSSTSSPATRPIIARRGATRRAPCSAGSGPATCSARATRRPSRS